MLKFRFVAQFFADLRQAVTRWSADDGSVMAAATAYYLGVSFFPLLLVLIAGLALFFQYTHLGQDAQLRLLDAIKQNMSLQLADYVKQSLLTVQDRSSIGGPIGLATMLLASLAAFGQLDSAFDRIWGYPQPESQNIWRYLLGLLAQRGRAFLALLGLGTVVVIVFLAGMVLTAVQTHTETVMPLDRWVWDTIQIGVTFVTNTVVFTLLFRLLPKVKVRWMRAFQGGLLTAVAWEIGRQLITIVVAQQIQRLWCCRGIFGNLALVLLLCGDCALRCGIYSGVGARAKAERKKRSVAESSTS